MSDVYDARGIESLGKRGFPEGLQSNHLGYYCLIIIEFSPKFDLH